METWKCNLPTIRLWGRDLNPASLTLWPNFFHCQTMYNFAKLCTTSQNFFPFTQGAVQYLGPSVVRNPF